MSGANLFCFAVFWVLKLIVFNRILRVQKMQEIDEHLRFEEENRQLVAKVRELQGDRQVRLFEDRHRALEVVALLASHANLVTLDR